MDNTNTQDQKDINRIPISTIEQWSGYWRMLTDRKKRLHDVSIRQIMLGQIFTLFVTMGAGFFISQNAEALLLVGTSLLLYPVIAESLSSSAATLVASLHHHLDTVSGSKLWFIVRAFAKSLFVALTVCLVLGVIGGAVGAAMFDAKFMLTVKLAALSGTFTGLLGLPIMVVVLLIARHIQVNPDDVAPPIETTVFHTLTLVAIITVSKIML